MLYYFNQIGGGVMINKIGQVMLYVNDVEAVSTFWEDKLNFVVRQKSTEPLSVELAPTEDSETSFVLHDKEFIAKMSPELHLGTPSILLYSNDLEKDYQTLQGKGVKVGAIVELPHGKVFNFADVEENYFAIIEPK